MLYEVITITRFGNVDVFALGRIHLERIIAGAEDSCPVFGLKKAIISYNFV